MSDVSTSKFLSLILRHKPETVDLTLDSAGWVEVGVLLAALRKYGHALDKVVLDRIVATNDKKRFEYNQDGTKIRACQGHSLKDVDLQLEAKEPPAYLFHGTAAHSLAAITAEGLKAQSRQYVHLSLDVETATKVGQRHGKPVVLLISAGKMHADGYPFYLSHNNVWLAKEVPSKYINMVNVNNDAYPLSTLRDINLALKIIQKPLDMKGLPLGTSHGKTDTL